MPVFSHGLGRTLPLDLDPASGWFRRVNGATGCKGIVVHPKVAGEARPPPPARCSALPAGRGIEIAVIGNDTSAQLDFAALECAIGSRTELIAITHVRGVIN